VLLQVQIRPGLVHKDEDGESEKVDKIRVALGILYKPKFHYPIAHTSTLVVCADGAVQTSPLQQYTGSEVMAGDGTARCIALA
jgi:hypothetical protein